MKRALIDHLSPSDLVKLKLKELRGLAPIPMLDRALKEVEKEIAKKLSFMKLNYFISDEWFCADKTITIAIPFYLFHPKLYSLEKEMMIETFEKNLTQLKRIIRHELGHAVDNAYKLRLCSEREKIFGNSSKAYPEYYSRKLFSGQFVKNLPDNYAQAHPDEDFAETFAVWLDPNTNWKTKYKNKIVLRKLVYMNKLMNKIKNTRPVIVSTRRHDDISKIELSLKNYYIKKKRTYLKPAQVLTKNFAPIYTKRTYSQNQVVNFLSKKLKVPRYKTNLMVKTIFKSYPVRKENLSLSLLSSHLQKNGDYFLKHHFDRIPL